MVQQPLRRQTGPAVSQTVLAAQMIEARRLHIADRLDEAEALYLSILKAAPREADAWHLLGLLKHQQGNAEAAIDHLRQAGKLQRDNSALTLNLARVLTSAGETDAALDAFRKIVRLAPSHVEARIEYGKLLTDVGRFVDAMSQFDKALAIDPVHLDALALRGNLLRAVGQLHEALASYDRALAAHPPREDVCYNRGLLLFEMGRHADAVHAYDAALALRPTLVLAHNNRGNALKALGRLAEALASYDRALAIEPDRSDIRFNRGIVLADLGRHDAALAEFDATLALNPGLAIAYVRRGEALSALFRPQEALASYERALAIAPKCVPALTNKGNLLKHLGQFKEAQAAFEAAMALEPTSGTHVQNLTSIRKFAPGDPLIGRMEELLAKPDAIGPEDRVKLAYALAKALADIGEHGRAFGWYVQGAREKRTLVGYDEAAMMQIFDRIEAVFSAELFATSGKTGNPSSRPIFILGMPRSGTTLTEQILSSHAQVFGAGELLAFNQALNRAEDRAGTGPDNRFPEIVRRISADGLARLASDYLDLLRMLAPDAERVTDKMPTNFFFLGLIHLALPNARIIHTRRDARDTCVSCFTQLFTQEHAYSYDLGELGRFYRRYERLMAHWHRVLPPGSVLDVVYEDVVADPEASARRVLDYCDLPWDDACLSFHQSSRIVRTASATQVRQPIYDRSIGRWRQYEAELASLIAALGQG